MGSGRMTAAAILVWIATLAGAAVAADLAADDVTVSGNQFLRDGQPWIAEGVTLVGLVAPAKRLEGRQVYAAARADFGADMLAEVARFGADLVRYQVSQGGLDPKSPIHDPGYRDEVLMGIAQTRGAGFNVIVSMQAQGPSGKRDPTGMPSAATRRAWRAIAPALADDRGVLLEIFNEPVGNPRTPEEWEPWRKAMQGLVDTLRRAGAQNVLLVPGSQFSRSFAGAPAIDDPAGALGYALHPYLGKHNQTRAQWDKKFGDFSRTHPVMATEFNAQAGGSYCRPGLEAQAADLLGYLREKRIGLVAWALDMPNLRAPDGSYTTLDDLVCGKRNAGGKGGAGELIHEYFEAH